MNYSSLRACVDDLEKNGHLLRIHEEVDPYLEMAEIHRRVFEAKGPAIYFEKVKGSPFPAVSNLYGNLERSSFMFRKTLPKLKKVFEIKANPKAAWMSPLESLGLVSVLWNALPKKVGDAPILHHTTTIDQLPQIQCWPDDGGAFVLLPQVYTEDIDEPGIMKSNMGMYRIQLSGNDYAKNKEIGLHYQIRRDIGIHHTKALAKGEPMRVSIFVGGPPSHTFSAVMYLPEKLPEAGFAGALGGRRFRYVLKDGFVISADADFCITGYVDPGATKPEGPFGDHLGYYSLKHLFPYLKVENVYHRPDAIWPFTVVGRPPQEDSSFGHLVQEIAGPVIRTEIPGIKSVHAVDAAGVHPLLLAIGSERYTPYEKRKPQELLTLANALLGYGPCSLAKYLMIVSAEDNPKLDVHDIKDYLIHLLERIDWQKDLHFQTESTIDTLDYSGTGINQGSKVVMAAAGEKRRTLGTSIPGAFNLLEGFTDMKLILPGVVAIQGPEFQSYETAEAEMNLFAKSLNDIQEQSGIVLIILCDDSEFTSESMNNFLWTTFTRSNPSHDLYGYGSSIRHKHWGCEGPLVIDARIKPHHAPPLLEDSKVVTKVNEMTQPGGCLHGVVPAKECSQLVSESQ